MRHPYNPECQCERCAKERNRRLEQSKANRGRQRDSKRLNALDRQARRHYENGDHDYSMNG